MTILDNILATRRDVQRSGAAAKLLGALTAG